MRRQCTATCVSVFGLYLFSHYPSPHVHVADSKQADWCYLLLATFSWGGRMISRSWPPRDAVISSSLLPRGEQTTITVVRPTCHFIPIFASLLEAMVWPIAIPMARLASLKLTSVVFHFSVGASSILTSNPSRCLYCLIQSSNIYHLPACHLSHYYYAGRYGNCDCKSL